MSDPKKPQRLSGEGLSDVRETADVLVRCLPVAAYRDQLASQLDTLFDHIAALTAELEERTRERDEAVDELRRIHETARQVIDSQASKATLTVLRNAVSYLDQKGPANDR